MRKSHVSAVAVAVATVLTASQASYAQEAATESGSGLDGPMEEIVVTAQKREESIQSVPLSVAAFSGTALARSGVDSALELSRLVPNMNISRAAQTAAVRLVIRGVGAIGNTAIDPSIGTFLDGVYVPRPGALFGQFNDIAAVEVLRGPQERFSAGIRQSVASCCARPARRTNSAAAPSCSSAATTNSVSWAP